MKIKELKEPYKTLSIIRHGTAIKDLNKELLDAFGWDSTPEKHKFWERVDLGEKPDLPHDSVNDILRHLKNKLKS